LNFGLTFKRFNFAKRFINITIESN